MLFLRKTTCSLWLGLLCGWVGGGVHAFMPMEEASSEALPKEEEGAVIRVLKKQLEEKTQEVESLKSNIERLKRERRHFRDQEHKLRRQIEELKTLQRSLLRGEGEDFAAVGGWSKLPAEATSSQREKHLEHELRRLSNELEEVVHHARQAEEELQHSREEGIRTQEENARLTLQLEQVRQAQYKMEELSGRSTREIEALKQKCFLQLRRCAAVQTDFEQAVAKVHYLKEECATLKAAKQKLQEELREVVQAEEEASQEADAIHAHYQEKINLLERTFSRERKELEEQLSELGESLDKKAQELERQMRERRVVEQLSEELKEQILALELKQSMGDQQTGQAGEQVQEVRRKVKRYKEVLDTAKEKIAQLKKQAQDTALEATMLRKQYEQLQRDQRRAEHEHAEKALAMQHELDQLRQQGNQRERDRLQWKSRCIQAEDALQITQEHLQEMRAEEQALKKRLEEEEKERLLAHHLEQLKQAGAGPAVLEEMKLQMMQARDAQEEGNPDEQTLEGEEIEKRKERYNQLKKVYLELKASKKKMTVRKELLEQGAKEHLAEVKQATKKTGNEIFYIFVVCAGCALLGLVGCAYGYMYTDQMLGGGGVGGGLAPEVRDGYQFLAMACGALFATQFLVAGFFTFRQRQARGKLKKKTRSFTKLVY